MSAKEPAFVEYFVAKGEDVTFPCQHTLAEDDPTPVDITGWNIQVKAIKADNTPLFTVGAVLTTPVSGNYSWTITHALSNVPPGTYALNIWRTDAGAERALAIGTIKIGKDAQYP